MRRRDFIIATGIVSAGLAIGLPGLIELSKAEAKPVSGPVKSNRFTIKYPHGGCTESSIAIFDNGPCGKDPFGFYS